MSKLGDIRIRALEIKDRGIDLAKDYSKRATRAGMHVGIHFLQGAEFGAKIGGTAGLLVGGMLAIVSGQGFLSTMMGRGGVIVFGGVGSIGGALVMTFTSWNKVVSELKGVPVPVKGIRTSGYSLPDFVKVLVEKLQERGAIPTPAENGVAGSVVSASPDFSAASKTAPPILLLGDPATQQDHIHPITPEERFTLIEMMLPDYVQLLDIKTRTGNTTLYDPQKFQLEVLSPGITENIDTMFAADPDFILRATQSPRGIHALAHSRNIDDLKMLMNLSWSAWGRAALPQAERPSDSAVSSTMMDAPPPGNLPY
jgi:hypothetical protein